MLDSGQVRLLKMSIVCDKRTFIVYRGKNEHDNQLERSPSTVEGMPKATLSYIRLFHHQEGLVFGSVLALRQARASLYKKKRFGESLQERNNNNIPV